MIQEIAPHSYDNNYVPQKATESDYLILYKGNKVLLLKGEEQYKVPSIKELMEIGVLKKELADYQEKLQFLFKIDETSFYMVHDTSKEEREGIEEAEKKNKIEFCSGEVFRDMKPMYMAFAGITGMQLARFAFSHQYCGRCGHKMVHSEKERAYICEACGLIEYPKISPAVIVAIIDKERDKILLTKYAYGEYRKYALVAGFAEVGESFEATVHREVMEEVGLKVKNIRYYKSQPWSFSDTIMVGFFAELDGDNTIVRQEEELAEAVWMSREEMTDSGRNISIGHEMMELFRTSQYKELAM